LIEHSPPDARRWLNVAVERAISPRAEAAIGRRKAAAGK